MGETEEQSPLDPPRRFTAEGEPRRVGVEIEFTGLSAARTADLLVELFGGRVEEQEAYRCLARDTRHGDFTVELDWSHAHPDKPRPSDPEQDSIGDSVVRGLREALGSVGELVMPMEVTTPPMALAAIAEMDELVRRLRAAGASGTRGSPLYAFGLQLNPELAARDAGYLAAMLKAFLLLEDRLRESAGVDPSRRLTPFVSPFPSDYVRRVVDPGYWPDLPRLIDDYLAANPTRNRDLDLLPAFAFLDPERVRRRVSGHLVKPRPTFHYRLPDSLVGRPEWSVSGEWQRWLEVERLAEDREALERGGRALLARRADDFWSGLGRWLGP